MSASLACRSAVKALIATNSPRTSRPFVVRGQTFAIAGDPDAVAKQENALATMIGPQISVSLAEASASTGIGFDDAFTPIRKLSITFFSPAWSKATVSLLPSTAFTWPWPNFTGGRRGRPQAA